MSTQPKVRPARRHQAAGRPRARRAFTLVELAIVVGIGMTLFLVLTKWVLSLQATANTGGESMTASRDVAYAESLLRADTQAARGCDPAGQDAPLRDLRADSVQMYVVHTDAGGVPQASAPIDLVVWRLSGSDLQRAVITGDDNCQFDPTTAQYKTVASGVRAAGAAAFTGFRHGAAQTSADSYGDCTGLNAERCLDDGLGVSLAFAPSGPDSVSAPLSTVYPISITGSGL